MPELLQVQVRQMRHRRPWRLSWACVVVPLIFFQGQQLQWTVKIHQQTVQNAVDSPTNDTKTVTDVAERFVEQVQALDGMTESLRRLLRMAVSPREYKYKYDIHSEQQIETDIETRCKRYGFQFSSNRPKRRIFWGSLIADDWWHILGIAAMEYHGLFDTIVFVESNTTQSGFPRTMRFPHGSPRKDLLTSPLLWGNSTRVHVDYFFSDNSTFYRERELWRENDQRNQIFRRWKRNGMTHDDIGFISDVDEVATRDFLLALQACDVPEFFPKPSKSLPADRPHDCLNPKVQSNSVVFEGSPKCLQVPRRWEHPDFLIGACLEGIGDPRSSVPRRESVGVNQRVPNWKHYVQHVPFKNTTIPLGPLWDATDVRMLSGSRPRVRRKISHGHINFLNTGYHFHNFFDSFHTLRRKYLTYGHPLEQAMNVSLTEIHPNDVGFMVDCLTGRSTSGSEWQQAKLVDWTHLDPLLGTPIAFQFLPDYMQLRHEELQKELGLDETFYPPGSIDAN